VSRDECLERAAAILVCLGGLEREDASLALATAVQFVVDDDKWRRVLDSNDGKGDPKQ